MHQLSIKQIATAVSVYSADSFGVCSALYELGGMVVMHDPSGCNSTYTTHDEPRWYDQSSLIFISGLEERDAILGKDEKFIQDVVATATKLKPACIALVRTPIPLMIGTDFSWLEKRIGELTHIPTFSFNTNNMNSYVYGASLAFEMLARNFIRPVNRFNGKGIPINIIGATPIDFSLNGSVDSIEQFLEANGYDVISTWAMGSTLQAIENSSAAQVNLIVSYAGLAAAEVLKEKFAIPYVLGVPLGQPMQQALLRDLDLACKTKENQIAFVNRLQQGMNEIALIGESVYMESMAYSLSAVLGVATKVICPLETSKALVDSPDVQEPYEDGIAAQLKDVCVVIADPLYKPLIPPGVMFVPLPHIGFSGRCFEKSIPDLVTEFAGFLRLLPDKVTKL